MSSRRQPTAELVDERGDELVIGEAVALDVRAASFVLRAAGAIIDVLAYVALLLLMLLGLAPAILDLPSQAGKRLLTFDLTPDAKETPEPTQKQEKQKPAGGRTTPKTPVAKPVPPAAKPVETPASKWPSSMIVMSRDEIATTSLSSRETAMSVSAAFHFSAPTGSAG